MSDEATTTVVTAAPGVTKKKPTKKKVATKKATKKAAPKKAAAPVHGIVRDHDLPWNEKKVMVFKALRNSKLSGGEGTSADLIKLSGDKLTPRDVRHYCYHAKAAGLVNVKEPAEGNGYLFSLTAAGRKVDPDKAFKDQKEAKKAK